MPEEEKKENKSSKEARGEALKPVDRPFKPSPSGESKGITGHDLLGKARPDLYKAESEGRGITAHKLVDQLRSRSEVRNS